MRILLINPTLFGTKTGILVDTFKKIIESLDESNVVDIIDFKNYNLDFSDGRNYLDYQGDTLEVLQKVMDAEEIVIVTPTYQASIPAPLKNLFDLLPEGAFLGKNIGLIVSAGSEKHYLMAQQQLFPILQFMKANVITQIVFATALDFMNHELVNDDVKFRMERLAQDLLLNHQVSQELQQQQNLLFDF